MKRPTELKTAERVAGQVVATLSPFVERIEVAGSIRRCKPVVGDVDIIVGGIKEGFVEAVLGLGGTFAKVSGQIEIDAVYVDVEVMPIETWGCALQYRTGSREFNVWLRGIAKKNGWKLSQHGLRDRETGELIGGKTEIELFQLLGIPYLPPEKRSTVGRLWQEFEDLVAQKLKERRSCYSECS